MLHPLQDYVSTSQVHLKTKPLSLLIMLLLCRSNMLAFTTDYHHCYHCQEITTGKLSLKIDFAFSSRRSMN